MPPTISLRDNEREVIYDRQIRRKYHIAKDLRVIGGIYIISHIGQFASRPCSHFHVDLSGPSHDRTHLLVPAFSPNGYTLDNLIHHQRAYFGMSEEESVITTDPKSIFWGHSHQGNLISLSWFTANALRRDVPTNTKCIGVMKVSGLASIARSLLMRAAKRPHDFSSNTITHLNKMVRGELGFFFPERS